MRLSLSVKHKVSPSLNAGSAISGITFFSCNTPNNLGVADKFTMKNHVNEVATCLLESLASTAKGGKAA